ncbi:hypothetical protein FRC07_013039 [Ceratobasidium sp. 392]|nr:hypothetical protein FRC07_013039 [Ceratobasidium sp. 392]
MHSETDDPGADHLFGNKNLATGATASPRTNESATQLALPYGRQAVDIDASDESLPLSDLSNSPSPMTGRRLSLLSDASVNVPGPLTPTKRLFVDVAVNDASNPPLEYQRIHSTPYPKPRLPTQLTPYPQARIVSLPEWSRNRNPFLESLRNPRSVSSPVRLRPAPLSPIYHETDEEAENSFEISEYSSGSLAQPPHFAMLPGTSGGPSQCHQPNSPYISKDGLYAAPPGLFLTPPSYQSLTLSPPTTGPERPLPEDRRTTFLPQGDGLLTGHDSEGEVSSILQQLSLDASSQPTRSSVAASTTSRVSSPESIVFLSSMTKIPRTFLGVRRTTGDLIYPSNSTIHEQANHPYPNDNDEGANCHSLPDEPEATQPELVTAFPNVCPTSASSILNKDYVENTPHLATKSTSDQGWILFDEPPKPIPALHGPASLPYARCPSGAEGVVLDNSQPVDDLVWGLSEMESAPSMTGAHRTTSLPKLYDPQSSGAEHQATNYAHLPDAKSMQPRMTSTLRPQGGPNFDKREAPSTFRLAGSDYGIPAAHSNAKEKHVRFLDIHADNASTQAKTADLPPVAPQSQDFATREGISAASVSKSATESLALLLQEQLEKGRVGQLQTLERTKVPTRQETLDQLRRFGVPFRPQITSHSAMVDPLPSTRFQFVKKSGSLAGLLATLPPNQERPSTRYEAQVPYSFGQSRLEPRPTNAGSDSLSKAKSIPLLKLRERQHAEFKSRGAQSVSTKQASGDHPRSSRDEGDVLDLKQHLARPRGLSPKSNQPATSQMTTASEEPPTPAKAEQAGTSGASDHSPSRRRPRKSGRHVPRSNLPDHSVPPAQKENEQGTKVSDTVPRKSNSRQTGRKRGSQRNRSDSLPQAASRSG